ncbi:hypothetical protein EBU99_13860 [bacterium]|nr:hypothetical protein [bacterium]
MHSATSIAIEIMRAHALRNTNQVSLIALCALAAAISSGAFAQANSSNNTPLTIKDWTAAGSGCRARMSQSGDVQLTGMRTTNTTNGSKLVILNFSLPNYQLVSPPQNPATSITFAKECALRVVADPLGHARIKSIAARTPVVFSKDEKTGLTMQYILKLDGHIVAQSLSEQDAGRAIRNQEDKVVLSGLPVREENEISANSCGSRQMLGFDYTFIAARSKISDSAQVGLSENKQLELAVELEPCRS